MATAWTVPREWAGETCVVLASGPSMNRRDAEFVRGRCRVIAVSNQGVPNKLSDGRIEPALAPWADVLYAADENWWRYHRGSALAFSGLKVTVGALRNGACEVLREFPQVLMLQNSGRDGFDDRPTHLKTGGNSGYQAIHLAAHFGAKRILLLGFDMRGTHWFGNHPKPLGRMNAYGRWLRRFAGFAAELKHREIEVINCTPKSALTCFEHRRLAEAFAS